MSSSAPNFASSPFSITSPRRIPKSKFTHKQLHQLKSYSTQTPLRVIAHIDLDAFYAQCEMARLGIPASKPLAVQQWQGLIAINYAARDFGLSRHVTSTEALKLCPELIMQHVATWREGDEKWAYHEDAFKNMATHKVSLDPYRIESRKIFKCITGALPEKEQRVEKAGIDEVFLDLSAQVYTVLLERFPELRGPAPYDDPTEHLPKVPTTVLDWAVDALVETGEEDGEDQDPDWDDVCTAIASEIVRHVRKSIKDTLGYTCSGGISKNKMLAKLGSGYKKPNQQTVIRNRAITHFLSDMKFTKIRMLGGKLGDEAVAMFGTDQVKNLMEQPLDQLRKLGDDTGSWLYSTIRGEDNSEVTPRTEIKSMLSAKSFRPSINSFEQGVRWLRIFAADIFSRCVEEGVLENKRRPRTINLHHRQGAQTRRRQSSLPQGKPLSETILFDLAKTLLAQIVVDGRAWPCVNLSLSVGGFEDSITNNKGIGGFLLRGEEAKTILSTGRPAGTEEPPLKRRRMKGNIANFFGPRDDKQKDLDTARAVLFKAHSELIREETEYATKQEEEDTLEDVNGKELKRYLPPTLQGHNSNDHLYRSITPGSAQPQHGFQDTFVVQQLSLDTYFCAQCNIYIPPAEKVEHGDYHFALDLSKEMQHEGTNPLPSFSMFAAQDEQRVSSGQKLIRGRGRSSGSGVIPKNNGVEKGQAKLLFRRQG
ncbi:hypothetical protein GQ44DRAFT_713668 [Phaeosphaeriaceae sp. PMI808]|nr:hypothetical protein GQ44DRAFT_713668 [Phaeosphaeriaceae sp. PMI808]